MSESNVARDYTGVKFNRLTGIRFIGWKQNKLNRASIWEWKCDCGKLTQSVATYVVRGKTKSCGCLRADSQFLKHGHFRNNKASKIMRTWQSILTRCNNPHFLHFPNYGGRGIKVLWNTFEEFERDMGSTCKDGLSIGRIDNNGHYCKENCRWETPLQQMRNTRLNHFLEWNGERRTISEWAELTGICYETLCSRIRYGWDTHKALTFPVAHKIPKHAV